RAFGDLKEHGKAALPALLRAAKDDDPIFLAEVALALGAVSCGDEKAINSLIHLLEHSTNQSLTCDTVKALGAIGTKAKAAIPLLIDLANNKDNTEVMQGIKCESILALGQIGDGNEQVIAVLKQAIHNDNESISQAARIALAHIGKH